MPFITRESRDVWLHTWLTDRALATTPSIPSVCRRVKRNVLRDNIKGITNLALRQLARRGGVKRIKGIVYEKTRNILKRFLVNVVRDTIAKTKLARRKTVTVEDVMHALKQQGCTTTTFNHI
jgi:histone H4